MDKAWSRLLVPRIDIGRRPRDVYAGAPLNLVVMSDLNDFPAAARFDTGRFKGRS